MAEENDFTSPWEKPILNIRSRPHIVIRVLNEFVALVIWGAIFLQVFVVNIDQLIAKRLDWLGPLLPYRFLIMLGFICCLLYLGANRKLRGFVLYFVFYPLIVMFWKLPRLLWRNWPLLVAFFPAFYAVASSFKERLLLLVVVLVAGAVILGSQNAIGIWLSVFALIGYLSLHFVRRFGSAFSSRTPFTNIPGLIARLDTAFLSASLLNVNADDIEKGTDEYQAKYMSNLMIAYFINFGLYASATKLRDVLNSRKLDVYFAASIVFTFLVTTILFSLIYFGIYKVQPESFMVPSEVVGWLSFVGYSLDQMLPAGQFVIKSASPFAAILSYGQSAMTYAIIVLLVILLFNSLRERYRQDLDVVIEKLDASASKFGVAIENNSTLLN